MEHPTTMVVIGEHEWTLQALHRACTTVKSNGNQIVLLKMVPVGHHMLLGTDVGSFPTRQEQRSMLEYASVADSYAVSCAVCVFQYVAYSDALVSAAEQLDVRTIFVSFPEEWIAAWRRFKIWWLKTRLLRHDRALHVIEQAVQA